MVHQFGAIEEDEAMLSGPRPSRRNGRSRRAMALALANIVLMKYSYVRGFRARRSPDQTKIPQLQWIAPPDA
jgi:hypothetical protein